MTRAEIVATLRYCAEHCDSQAETELVAWVAEKFAERLYPLAEHRPTTVWRQRAQFRADAS